MKISTQCFGIVVFVLFSFSIQAESLLQRAVLLKSMVSATGQLSPHADCGRFIGAFPRSFNELIDLYAYRSMAYKVESRITAKEVLLMGPLSDNHHVHFKIFFDCKNAVSKEYFRERITILLEELITPYQGWPSGSGFEWFLETELFEGDKLREEYIRAFFGHTDTKYLDNLTNVFPGKEIYSPLCEYYGPSWWFCRPNEEGHRHH